MNKQRLISFTQELVRERSLSGQEDIIAGKILAEMNALGFDQAWVDDYGNVIGVIDGELPGKTLLLDGHCDIVDARAEDWLHDPFAAILEDGYLYGRGVADMKASLAAMLYAAASVERRHLAGRVAVCATVSEEVMEGVALEKVIDQLKPDYIIIGESTNFMINRAGRGRAEIVIETIGKSAHSSSPQAGLCAIHEMMRLMPAVESIVMPSHPAMGNALMCVTDIISEPFPGHSVVPNRCRVSYDRRLVPGETPESVTDAILSLPALKGMQYTVTVLQGEEKTYTGKYFQGIKFFPAWVLDEEHPLVVAAQRGLASAGFTPELGAYRFCTNAAYSAGIAGIPTIGFGPGRETDAHIVEERLAVADIERAANGFLAIIQSALQE